MTAAPDLPDQFPDIPTADLLRELAETLIETNNLAAAATVQRAIREMEALRTAAIYHSWESIETAPVEPYKPDNYNMPFRCLLQNERDEVSEGEGYWAMQGRRPNQTPALRWRNRLGQCFPKYWTPLPAPKVEA